VDGSPPAGILCAGRGRRGAAMEEKMADDQTDAPKPSQSAPPLVINGQYIKDLSFEAPTAPGVYGLLQKEAPEIQIAIDVRGRNLQDAIYEVVLHVKAECKVAQTAAFIVELVYGGMFTINVAAEQLQPMLLVECPRYLFPFARTILADVTRDGGFPPLMLSPVDFTAMYMQSQRERAAQAQAAGQPTPGAA
jgi:preprotein translocase subunit SecB